MKCDCNISPYLMQTCHNKHNFNIIKNINITKKLVTLKNNVTKIRTFSNVTSIHNSHVSIISIIQHNSDVNKKRSHLNKQRRNCDVIKLRRNSNRNDL